jgi:nucleoside-diphosphate-sugar epimerase
MPNTKSHNPTTLLTGATGFLGHFILRDLLVRGRNVVAMLRAPLEHSHQRLQAMLAAIDLDMEKYLSTGRLRLVEGALPDDMPECRWGETDDILTSAASLQLASNGNGEPYKTNVAGIETLLAWANRHGVRTLHAVSTAYVCGSFKGHVREVFHPLPPGFQTDYERSKWHAEEHLQAWAQQPGHKLTILRPSFLVGDSRTGYTTQFGGFYQFARLLNTLRIQYAENGNGNGHGNDDRIHIPLCIPGRKDDPVQDFVPVDYASRIISEIVCNPALHGNIYHLTDPSPPSLDHFKEWLEEYFNIHGGYYVDELPVHRSSAESLMWEKYDLFVPRIRHHIRFDQSNTRRVMDAMGVRFPAMTRERFHTMLDYAATQDWGAPARRKLARVS